MVGTNCASMAQVMGRTVLTATAFAAVLVTSVGRRYNAVRTLEWHLYEIQSSQVSQVLSEVLLEQHDTNGHGLLCQRTRRNASAWR